MNLHPSYLSGCSCCPSDSLIGCVRPGGGPGRTGWANHVQTGPRWGLSPCSSSPSPHDGSRGQEVAGPSGCPSSYWHCDSLSSCTEDEKHTAVKVRSIPGMGSIVILIWFKFPFGRNRFET